MAATMQKEDHGDRKGTTQALTAAIQSVIDAGTPALSVAIQSGDNSIFEVSSGLSNVQSAEPLGPNQPFGIGSVTKVFVAVTVLQILESRSISLDTRLSELLAESILRNIAHAKDATIESLLRHTSGIKSWEDDPKWIVEGRGAKLDHTKIWSKTETLDYIRRPSHSDDLKPGSFSYSNTNYTLLGLVIEKLAGQQAESEIRRRVLQPLGMSDTYLEGFESPPARQSPVRRYHWATPTFVQTAGICPSFQRVGSDLIDVTGSNLSVEWTAGGIVTTAKDLLAFATALKTGRLLSPEMWNAISDWKPVAPGREVGLGLFRLELQSSGRWIGHYGSVLGFTAVMLWSEDMDCSVVVLSNIGTMHAGKNPGSAQSLVEQTDFLVHAKRLTELADDK